MVNILAEEILSDTQTFTVTNGELINDLNETFTVSTNLSEFAYVENVLVSSSSTDIDLANLSGGDNTCTLELQADFLFNNVVIASTTTLNVSSITLLGSASGTEQFNEDEVVFTADSYFDGPLDIRYTYTTDNNSGRQMEFNGDQTFDITAGFTLVGRTP